MKLLMQLKWQTSSAQVTFEIGVCEFICITSETHIKLHLEGDPLRGCWEPLPAADFSFSLDTVQEEKAESQHKQPSFIIQP